MATLYSQATQNNYSNFNDGTVANRNYAWEFVASATGTPTSMDIYLAGKNGSPTATFYIKADKTAASTTYATSSSVTFSGSGANTVTFTSGSEITSGVKYWVYMQVTTNSSNYPQIQYDTSKANYKMYRPSASNIDPDTLWFTYDIKMTITGTSPATNTGNFFLFF